MMAGLTLSPIKATARTMAKRLGVDVSSYDLMLEILEWVLG